MLLHFICFLVKIDLEFGTLFSVLGIAVKTFQIFSLILVSQLQYETDWKLKEILMVEILRLIFLVTDIVPYNGLHQLLKSSEFKKFLFFLKG